MAQLDTLDIAVLLVLLLGTIAYFTKGTYWAVQKDPYAGSFAHANGVKAGKTRNIVEKLEESGKNCIIFYGSQTGTAEDYASRLAKEGASRFGLKTMTADLEDYDFDTLDALPEDKIAIFVLATYGEGEPTDNAVEFFEFINGEEVTFSNGTGPDEKPLSNLKYVAFGLGNNTYEHYQAMVRKVNAALEKLGGQRVGDVGEGDDGAGTMEEDFLSWKEPMWAKVAEVLSLEERDVVYEAAFAVTEKPEMDAQADEVYLGEPNKHHLEGKSTGPYNANNPFIAPIAESREIFTDEKRNCLHMEIDVSGSNLTYTTGDHIAVWPTNPGREVNRFLNILGLGEKRHMVISVKSLDPTAKVPFPSPTTYDAVVRYHMEICAPVSRQFVGILAPFAPNDSVKAEVTRIGSDSEYFKQKVASQHLNIGQLLEIVAGGEKWTNIPFSLFIEGIHKIQPRYYSISSSSLVQPNRMSITAVVESREVAGAPHIVKGVTTNYLLALKQKQHGDPNPDPHGLTYAITGPRNKYDGVHVPVHVRHSNFKLPSDPSTPIIMVGPGTGVAPFRGFVQERAALAKTGETVGKTLLFFGCRNRKEDFLYEKDWEQFKRDLGDAFEIVVAFSRETPGRKVYVQHKLKERAKQINDLLEQKANFYVCGDAANMAREVNILLAQIIAEQRGLDEKKAEDVVKAMRAAVTAQLSQRPARANSLSAHGSDTTSLQGTPPKAAFASSGAPLTSVSPPREIEVTRRRGLSASNAALAGFRSHQAPDSPSPRSNALVDGIANHAATPDSGIETKSSCAYGHHRQMSILDGKPHSRRPSLANPSSATPISPQSVASVSTAGTVQAEPPPKDTRDGLLETPSPLAAKGDITNLDVKQQRDSEMAGDSSAGDRVNRKPSQKRAEYLQSARAKLDLTAQPIPSRHGSQLRPLDSHQPQAQQAEQKTVGEYALHHLFNAFVVQADQKISRCVTGSMEPERRVESICGPGVDPNFDQLISALGHIARQKPKYLIDTLMFWRKAKGDVANSARVKLDQARVRSPALQGTLSRRNTEQTTLSVAPYSAVFKGEDQRILALQEEVYRAESRTTVSIYLLCRVLIEIVGQSNLASITTEMAVKLEETIYNQLKVADRETLEESPMKHANWTIFAQLLGVMSKINFESVANRFVMDLGEAQKSLSIKGSPNKDVESRTVLIIRSMRYLKLRTDSEEGWDSSCAFLNTLAKYFASVHGQPAKYAYCQLFEDLLLPTANTAISLLNRPRWKETVDILRQRLVLLLGKPKHWQNAFPLSSILLCVSPRDNFLAQWQPTVLNLQNKLKERAARSTALKAICRLVWTYLYKVSEPQHLMIRKVEEVIRLVFQPGKKSHISNDPVVVEPLIQLIRIIGVKFQELGFRTVIFPLLNADMFANSRERIKSENLEPERMVIAIRAFLAIVADLEKGEQPPFPSTFHSDIPAEVDPMSPTAFSPSSSSQRLKSSLVKEERLSRSVITTEFSDVTKQAYARFCQILGDITIICDETFGGQAALDQKFGSPIPKTPITEAFNFTRRDDYQGQNDPRQGFYDLLHVAVQALPRCLSPHIPFNHLINLLCTGTAHVQSDIAISSAQSLKSIARQSHAQQVTIGFARFIFNFDDRYSTMSDGGMLGAGHIESTLRLYVELLQIWIQEIDERTRRATQDHDDVASQATQSASLQSSETWGHVNEIESHGLFFLCSPSRRVRAFAVHVLRLIVEFDKALGKEGTRIIRIMEGSSQRVLDVNDEGLSVAERSRLQRGLRNSNLKSTLVELCSSDVPYDSTLWFKIFPNLIRVSFEVCPLAVAVTRDIVCARLSQIHKWISSLAEGTRYNAHTGFDFGPFKSQGRSPVAPPEKIIAQWKLHLIFACTTLTNTGLQQVVMTQNSNHTRKSSKSSQQSQEKIHSAVELFSKVIPLLSASNGSVRNAVVTGLGSINVNLFKTLLESLHSAVTLCNEEAKMRLGTHHRTFSTPRRDQRTDHLRTEITHVYKLISHFLRLPNVYTDDWILSTMVHYTKDIRLFLMDAEVQNEWDYQPLRTHYCGLVEEIFESINRTKDPMRWMPFQSRKAAFTLMEEWCGHSPDQTSIRQREEIMMRSVLDRERDIGIKGRTTATMAIEIKALRHAALSAMAALCAGPIQITTESKVLMQFHLPRMLGWIDSIFDTQSDRIHAIGRKALKNLIIHNRSQPYLLEWSIEKCFAARSAKALESCFEVITEILIEHEDYQLPFWKVLGAGLYTLGNESSQIRMKSTRLLRTMEERQHKQSKLQDLDISISDKTTAVYKQAQFEMSCKLADQHSELAFHVFSEFSRHFRALQPDHQRNMVAAMLPWLHKIQLQIDLRGEPTAKSYMLLVNLFEITIVCSSTALHNEVLGLWKAVASGPYGGNVKVVLDFIKNLCLEKREQNFVDYAKQIVVFLSGTPAGMKVIDDLLLEITPKAMIPQERPPAPVPQDALSLPYLADLSLALPVGNKQTSLSMGQLCLILLVDLVVRGVNLEAEKVPTLLQVVLALWDHYTPLVRDHAREMLVHLLHELVISRLDDNSTDSTKSSIEDFIELIRRHDAKVVWTYDHKGGPGSQEDDSIHVPDSMIFVAHETIKCFEVVYPRIREAWAKVTLHWATNCPVRHLACRSFEIFRCIFLRLDQPMLADMLARLSNVIADDNSDTQSFSMEVLMTLKTIIGAFDKTDLLHYGQFFWTTCACLTTSCEHEYMESLSMLETLLDKLDLSDPAVVRLLEEAKPSGWEGSFDGLQSLIYNGIRSSVCLDRSLSILEKLAVLPSGALLGSNDRILFTILANLPKYLLSLEEGYASEARYRNTAGTLADVAEEQGHAELSKALRGFATSTFKSKSDLVSSILPAVRSSFFPRLEFQALTFMMGSLTNKLPWMKIYTMELLCEVIPDIDMRKPEIACQGPDLISPLLRLLQTDYCRQALKVLDKVMDMPGTPMDNRVLRMSMAGSHSSRASRKEYERTKSLYGIPEESGWSIPMPAIQASVTRANVHAVWRTCTSSGAPAVEEDAATTPEVEFTDERPHYVSYFSDRTATMTSESDRGEANMGELVQKLNSLDDFFEDSIDDIAWLQSNPSAPHLSSALGEIRENVYHQQTFPILNKSLARNASVSSFKTGFADNTSLRSPRKAIPTLSAAPMPMKRPRVQARSVTSPPTMLMQQQRSLALSAEPLTETEGDTASFSDDEMSVTISRTQSQEKPASTMSSFDSASARPTAHSRASGLRSGFRRVMGREDDGGKQPKVPPVPSVYLKNSKIGGGELPRSADL